MENKVFNRSLLHIHRNRAAGDLHSHDFLIKNSVEDIIDRVLFYGSDYENALELGCRTGYFKENLPKDLKIKSLYQTEIAPEMIKKSSGIKILCDEEDIPFKENSFDLVVSVLNMHWLNKVIYTFSQVRNILKPGGLFIASIIGGSSLRSLRELIIKIEIELGLKVGLHISPMITSDSLVQLGQKTGFKNVIVDSHSIDARYSSPIKALRDLQKMGEGNCLNNKIKPLNKKLLEALKQDQEILLTFDIITISAFKS